MIALALAMVFLALIALGALIFMRDKSGGLTPGGLLTFIFFAGGTVACLYLMIFGV